MKRAFTFVLSLIITLSCITFSSAVSSSAILSPALEVISNGISMTKSGLVTGTISFSAEDFEKGVGNMPDSITITSLPSSADGILTYNGTAVVVNQTISSKGLAALKYIPNESSEAASFRFKTTGEYSMECFIKYTDTINLAPAVTSTDALPVWTQTDITTYGKLNGSDPENDNITFEITEYPAKGLLRLTDTALGNYTYTPCAGIKGKDSFSYHVVDEWGNYSDECSVIINIDETVSDVVFADMDEHWAHNAALVMASKSAMEYEVSDGVAYFRPSDAVTREEFLVSAMKILGAGEIEEAATIFADNDDISAESSGYVARAYSLGVINGTEKEGALYFEPASEITRAEAAVILNRIIGAEESDVLPAFADGDTVPTWAKGSLNALVTAGILGGDDSGTIAANDTLNRAQAAQILLKVNQIYN